MKIEVEQVASVIRETMGTLREDVAMGNGPDIEPDAVALSIGYGVAKILADENPGFDQGHFLAACDLAESIPSEAFRA